MAFSLHNHCHNIYSILSIPFPRPCVIFNLGYLFPYGKRKCRPRCINVKVSRPVMRPVSRCHVGGTTGNTLPFYTNQRYQKSLIWLDWNRTRDLQLSPEALHGLHHRTDVPPPPPPTHTHAHGNPRVLAACSVSTLLISTCLLFLLFCSTWVPFSGVGRHDQFRSHFAFVFCIFLVLSSRWQRMPERGNLLQSYIRQWRVTDKPAGVQLKCTTQPKCVHSLRGRGAHTRGHMHRCFPS